jgi:hypothetical protein
VTFGELAIGATPVPAAAPRRAPAQPDGGMVFPPYGRSKGAPVVGASVQDLEYYASGCRRTLNDPGKARWHDKERQLLAAIEAELARQGGGGRDDAAPFAAGVPPFGADDAPPPNDDDLPF